MPSPPPTLPPRLLDLQSLPCNLTCADCGRPDPNWASVTYGVFLCPHCAGCHRALGVHLSFVRPVAASAWPDHHLRLMESNPGGNVALNAFLSARGVPARADVALKYSSPAAALFRSRVDALAHGRPLRDPTASPRPPRPVPSDDWDYDDVHWSTGGFECPAGHRKNQSITGDLGEAVAASAGAPCRSWSSGDLSRMAQNENSSAAAAAKDSYFRRMVSDNRMRPEGIPPLKGRGYIGFGSANVNFRRSGSHGDLLSGAVSAVSEGFGRFSVVASSAVQSAASAVQAGTKELASKVSEGETVNVIAQKTTEIRQKTWGIVKDVMTVASQKVEEYAGEGARWKTEGLEPQKSVESDSSTDSPTHKDGKGTSSPFTTWDGGHNISTSQQQDGGKNKKTQSEDGWAEWD